MCLILLAYDGHSPRPLVVAANRDEFYARPAHAARYWDGAPHVFGGRDLRAGGTWLGVSTGGRFAALTNYTDFDLPVSPASSRGDLTRASWQDTTAHSPTPKPSTARATRGST